MYANSRLIATIVGSLLSLSCLSASADETSNVLKMNACEMPEYDTQMLRKEEKGQVKLRFSTDATGKVTEAEAKVEESSGFTNLDKASLSALKNCQFDAKKSANIVSKPSHVIAFTWAIK
nr:energy transducer TonB [uncultured Undibacterium sp.]